MKPTPCLLEAEDIVEYLHFKNAGAYVVVRPPDPQTGRVRMRPLGSAATTCEVPQCDVKLIGKGGVH